MTTFGWRIRLKYGLLAAGVGWLAGWMVSFPFELSIARRYVDGNLHQLPVALAKGSVVWGAFSLFMAVAGFVPLGLPVILLVPPAWIVRWRHILIPGATLAALLAIYHRMGLLRPYHFHHPRHIIAFFFTAPNFFVLSFTPVMTWVYILLAKRRLGRLDSR
jgi:hypothetical protein